MGGSLENSLSSKGCGVCLWWRRLLFHRVVFSHSKVIGCVKMRYAQLEVNQARLEMALLALLLLSASLERCFFTSDPCSPPPPLPPPPSPTTFTKSFNLSSSVTPFLYSDDGVHVFASTSWNQLCCFPPGTNKKGEQGRERKQSSALLIENKD